MKLDLREFDKRGRYITSRQHPSLPLLVWSYNTRCEVDQAWDEVTCMARGLITDLDGNIHARPFKRFRNITWGAVDIANLGLLGAPRIFEKLDGSLGILYWNGSHPAIATRSSFDSPQAAWATSWLTSKVARMDAPFTQGYTYLFEIIYPANRVLIDYHGMEELVLLAVIDTESGREVDPIPEAARLGFTSPRELGISLEEAVALRAILGVEQEGFVALFPDGSRLKIKGKEYLRLHKIFAGVSPVAIWECLSTGTSFDRYLGNVPDEFLAWVLSTKSDLQRSFDLTKAAVEEAASVVRALPNKIGRAHV